LERYIRDDELSRANLSDDSIVNASVVLNTVHADERKAAVIFDSRLEAIVMR
jgi:hypothetical protein